MSLNTFWKTRKPLVKNSKVWGDTYHAYITRFRKYADDYDVEGTEMIAFYGELKLCDNINMRRAPIANQDVLDIVIREPYEHCEKCLADIAWQERMNFGEVYRL